MYKPRIPIVITQNLPVWSIILVTLVVKPSYVAAATMLT